MRRLTTNQIARMRSQLDATLYDTCVIKNVVRTFDSAGRPSESYVPVTGGTVLCRLDTRTMKKLSDLEGGKLIMHIENTLTLPYDAPIDKDQVITHNGLDYRVVSLSDDASLQVGRRASIERTK